MQCGTLYITQSFSMCLGVCLRRSGAVTKKADLVKIETQRRDGLEGRDLGSEHFQLWAKDLDASRRTTAQKDSFTLPNQQQYRRSLRVDIVATLFFFS